MKLRQYLDIIRRLEIPASPPDQAFLDYPFPVPYDRDKYAEYFRAEDGLLAHIEARDELTQEYCLWTMINKMWVSELALWIGNRRVLEIMSGTGWLAKGLSEQGISIKATDSKAWAVHRRPSLPYVFPVQKMDAEVAVKKYRDQYDVLLVSWPPYGDKRLHYACLAWGSKPILYIGEENGCTADDRFHVHMDMQALDLSYPRWFGMHDRVYLGHYDQKREYDA